MNTDQIHDSTQDLKIKTYFKMILKDLKKPDTAEIKQMRDLLVTHQFF